MSSRGLLSGRVFLEKFRTLLSRLGWCVCVWVLISSANAVGAEKSDGDRLVKLAKKHFDELTLAEEQLFQATAAGTNLIYPVPDGWDAVTNSQSRTNDQIIRADRLKWLCTDPKAAAFITPNGVAIGGVCVSDEINLSDANLSFTFYATNCVFRGDINVQDCNLRQFGLVHCAITNLLAAELKTSGDVDLNNGSRALGSVVMDNAVIGGNVDCTGSEFWSSNALSLADASIRGDVYLEDKFKAFGMVSLREATLGGQLNCDGGFFECPNDEAINAEAADITGFVFMRGDDTNNFVALGKVDLAYASMAEFECVGGTMANSNGTALTLHGAAVKGDVYLNNGFRAEGQVLLDNAIIGGNLDCAGTNGGFFRFDDTNENPGVALDASGAKIGGFVALANNFYAEGGASLDNATVGDNLNCGGGMFTNSSVAALSMKAANIRGDVLLDNGFRAEGQVLLDNVAIAGSLNCAGTNGGFFRFDDTNENPGIALDASGAKIGGFVALANNFYAEGGASLDNATVGDNLNCGGGIFTNSGGAALSVGAASIKGDVFFNNGFTASGQVFLNNTTISGNLDCSVGAGGHFTFFNTNADPAGSYAVDAAGANIWGNVMLSSNFIADGGVDLDKVTVGRDLNCDDGEFIHSNTTALSIDGASIKGDVSMGGNFNAEGRVSLGNTVIGGDLECDHAHFHYRTNYYGESAFGASGVRVGGYARLSSVVADGGVNMDNATIGQDLYFYNGKFTNIGSLALSLNGANIKGNVLFNGARAEGQVDLSAASIQGRLDFDDAHFTCTNNDSALAAERLQATLGVSMSFFTATGGADLAYANLGNLESLGGKLSSSNLFTGALLMEHATVKGNMVLQGISARGRVLLGSANIAGDLDVSGSIRDSSRSGSLDTVSNLPVVFDADGAKVDGNVQLMSLAVYGGTSLRNMTIGGNLECLGGTFSNFGSVALNGSGIAVGGNVRLAGLTRNARFQATGEVDFDQATITNDLDCRHVNISGGVYTQEDGTNFSTARSGPVAFSAFRANIGGSLWLDGSLNEKWRFDSASVAQDFHLSTTNMVPALAGPVSSNEFRLSLHDAKVGTLDDNSNSWPEPANLNINGFVYNKLGALDPSNAEQRIEWLHLSEQTNFVPQPYEQLAAVLRNSGFEDEATTVMIEKSSDLRRFTHPPYLTSTWWWYDVFGWLTDYGYRPVFVWYISIGVILFGWLVFAAAYRNPRWKSGNEWVDIWQALSDKKCLFTPADMEKAYPPKASGGQVSAQEVGPDSQASEDEGVDESYPKFNAFFYSLETFVPLLKLEIGDYWRPNAKRGRKFKCRENILLTGGGLVRAYYWFHTIIGWVLTTLLVGALTGLIKS